MQSVLALILSLAVVTCGMQSARIRAGHDPLAAPASMVRLYLRALGSGQCDLAFKFAGQSGQSLGAFRRSCRSIRRVAIQHLGDPGYRLHRQNALYTCLAVGYTVYRRAGTSYGGWYVMERTLGPAWHILYAQSHVVKGGSAHQLTSTQCASHLPSYVRPGSSTVISGSAFLTPRSGWIALSTSGSYLPGGGCTHGIGSNCEAAPTVVYRTNNAGNHWTPCCTSPPPLVRQYGCGASARGWG